MHAKYQIKNKRSQQKNTATQTRRATEIMQLPYQRRLPIKWIMLTSSILYQATIKCSNSKYKQEVQRNLRNNIQKTLCKPQKIIHLNQL